MSVISRRQKEILLSDVQRMINNNNHTAFANHAKIAERVSNGDLTFYIDSPKKEFVIKYGNKEIRFNCNEQQMSELKAIKFDDNSTIKGISDSITSDSSEIALSTKWGKTIKNDLDNHNHDQQYASKNHNHDDQYAAKDHNHDSDYAPINHTHTTDYSPVSHRHSISDVTNLQNTLNTKANTNHTHFGIETEKDLEKFVNDHYKTPWYEWMFRGLGFIADVGEVGYLAGLQAQVNALMASMAGTTGLSAYNTTTRLGTTLLGYGTTIQDIGDSIGALGNHFESLKDVTTPINNGLREGSNYVKNWAHKVDDFLTISNGNDLMTGLLDAGHTVGGTGGLDIATSKLPEAMSILTPLI